MRFPALDATRCVVHEIKENMPEEGSDYHDEAKDVLGHAFEAFKLLGYCYGQVDPAGTLRGEGDER